MSLKFKNLGLKKTRYLHCDILLFFFFLNNNWPTDSKTSDVKDESGCDSVT